MPTLGKPTMPHLNPIILSFFVFGGAFSFGGFEQQRHLAHETGIVILGQQRRGFDHGVQHRHQPIYIALGEILQHMAGDQIFLAGMAHADAHPAVIRSQRGGDGAQAVLPGIAAAGLHFQLAGREIDLVMDHHQRLQAAA